MFTYSWHVDSNVPDSTVIRVYGLDKNNDNVCIRVNDFKPYVYLELPPSSNKQILHWKTPNILSALKESLDRILKLDEPFQHELKFMHKLYGAHIDENGKRKLYPYLKCTFLSTKDIETLASKIRYDVQINSSIGKVKLKIHEQTADPILQFTASQRLPASGWIEFGGRRVKPDDQFTRCHHEFVVKSTDTRPFDCEILARPLIMAYDIEANSSNPARMPKSSEDGDKIFQISCVFCRYGDKIDKWEPYLLTLGDPEPSIVNSRGVSTILTYKTESQLLVGFTDLINERNPNLLAGFNLLGFDIQYMVERAKHTFCYNSFDIQGFHRFAHAPYCMTSWSSSAFSNQEYKYLDTEGRVTVDLLPLVKRDFNKLDNYKLETISKNFYGSEHKKDPLNHKAIFKCYKMGTMKQADGSYSAKARAYMGVIGKYCLQDSLLVLRLMDTLETWVGLTEMATTCNISMWRVYTEGQQVRVYAQLYKYAMFDNTIVEKDGYIPGENERYTGAYVVTPVPGVYDDICPLDFKSLYPCTMIAYNIDYTTFVMDDEEGNAIPDEKCHIMTWGDHQNCLVEGTNVMLGSYSLRIEDMKYNKDEILGLTSQGNRLTPQKQKAFYDQGYRECVRLTFQDGTHLECTQDHKILTASGHWCEANNIDIGHKVCSGPTMPVYDINDIIVVDDYVFTDNKAIVFLQLLGLIVTDGAVTSNRTILYCGHSIDLKAITTAIDILSPNSYSIHRDKYCWKVTILGKLGQAFRNIDGMLNGKKKSQMRMLPTMIDKLSVGGTCAFLSGLFGGDGHTLCWGKGSKAFSAIGFSWSSDTKQQLEQTFIDLKIYLERCGIECTTQRLKKEPMTMLRITGSNIFNFQERIGFAFCIHKLVRLTVGCSYLRMREAVWKQQTWLIERVRNLKDEYNLTDSIDIAIQELHAEEPIYNKYYANPTKQQMTEYLRPRRRNLKPMFSYKYFPDPIKYLESINGQDVFTGYGVHESEDSIPMIHKTLIHRCNIGIKHVYDLSISKTQSFTGNGIVVHNCSHDPLKIRIEQLDKHIAKERVRAREIRAIRDSLKVVDFIDDIDSLNSQERKEAKRKASIAKSVEHDRLTIAARKIERSFKPQQEEREETKSRLKEHTMCETRKYRWLKEPKGILPTILEELLSARTRTRSRQKEIKKTMTGNEEMQTLYKVLEQRQLSVKVCANSIYGILGVRSRRYLPLIPAAMCVCYMGRVNIKLAAKTAEEKYGAQIVYGDTDSILCHFPHCKTTQETWDYAQMVADNITKLYPSPMELEFEEMIYKRYLILRKKQYVYSISDRDGNINPKLGKKGVVLARRDNCDFVRNVYQTAIQMIFDKANRDDVLYYVLTEIRKIVAREVDIKKLVISQSIKSTGDGTVEGFTDEKGNYKGKMGDYTIRTMLSNDPRKRAEQLASKDAVDDDDFYKKCLGAAVQLGEKLKKRGQRADAGSRLEFVITEGQPGCEKIYEKIECADYFALHSNILRLDIIYYLEKVASPMDKLLNIVYGKQEPKKRLVKPPRDSDVTRTMVDAFQLNIIDNMCKRYKLERKLINELADCWKPRIPKFGNCSNTTTSNTSTPNKSSKSSKSSKSVVKSKSKICEHPGCNTRPSYNKEGELAAKFCKTHKEADMINVTRKKKE